MTVLYIIFGVALAAIAVAGALYFLRPYIDIPLIAFVLPMVAAASITSHGTFIFYSYFLPVELAYAATIVLTVGIPLLEFAAVIDNTNRVRYILGMVWLLLMESVAQYWQGQAIFVSKVNAQFPNPTGIDLAMWANHWSGRLLPIIYLASLSGIVVYFGYAASARVKQLRNQTTPEPKQTESVLPVVMVTPQLTDTETVPAGKLAGVDVAAVLAKYGGNKTKTANELGVSPAAISKWLVKNGV